ncbi:MAG: serine/threonine-protein kinase, partial [Aureliella sp.]
TLGRGSFASVYLARQISMQRLVALKVSQRGSDEPIALSQLDHPSIVRVYDQRRISDPDAVLLYMQYVPGGTLADVIHATANLPAEALSGRAILQSIDQALLTAGQQPPEHSSTREYLAGLDWPSAVAWIGVQLAEGLAAAHERGIMHRDVKPANVLLSAEGSPKLADFNVSYGGTAGCAGAAVHFGGSLAYMSPEQLQVADPAGKLRPDELDSRSDLYSLAMVLWELWQGSRSVLPNKLISSWHEAVAQQIDMRRASPTLSRPPQTAAARVLEKTLRQTLRFDRELRPRSGQELAGRLKLALNARAAELFEPAEESLYAQVRRWPVLLTTALIIFVPNGLAGALNYQYNLAAIRADYGELEHGFVAVSIWVNCIAFPLGAAILILLARVVRRALRAAAQGQAAAEAGLDAAWNLGHRAAMIGGLLWSIAGIAFPLVLWRLDPLFNLTGAIEFFLSLTICGGIAWIYPFFGISLVASEIYYPAIVAPTMVDARFQQRASQLKTRCAIYLASAAAIPLFALTLLAARQTLGVADASESLFLLVITVLTGVALLFAFQAYQRLNATIDQLCSILCDTGGGSSAIEPRRSL